MQKIKFNFYYIQNKRMENNSFVLINKNYCYIIDPSWNSDDLILFIEKNNLILKGLIFTHLHWDHVGDYLKILNHFNCNKIFISKNSEEIVLNISNRLFINDLKFKNFNINYVDNNFSLENGLIKFLLTPGHSKCSMCIIFNDCILTGDHIFVYDIGRTDLDFSDKDEMRNSINIFKNYVLKNKINLIYPGHGDFSTIEYVLSRNNYLT